MLKKIALEQEQLEKNIERVEKELKNLPKGKLRCTSSRGTDQFFIDDQYISKKDLDHIQKIAQREYYEKLLPQMRANLKMLGKLEKIYAGQVLEKCYENQCEARKRLVGPLYETIENRITDFKKIEYEPGEFEEDDRTEYYSNLGERVRSKSEKIIADELIRHQIPYHYEMPLVLQDWGKRISIRPDFTVMSKRTGKIYIFEHLGMMDKPSYVENCMRKLDLYEKNGYLLGENLICTRETSRSPLSSTILENYIKTFFL